MSQHALNALCKIAASENWCWNIYCRTCGAMHFRYALKHLAHGADPASSNWRVRRKSLDRLEPEPPRWKFSIEDQERIVSRVRESDIGDIASTIPFPDYLGHLGLILFYTENAEDKSRTLTEAWTPSLIKLVHPESKAWQDLTDLATKKQDTLKWFHLGMVEKDSKHQDLDLSWI